MPRSRTLHERRDGAPEMRPSRSARDDGARRAPAHGAPYGRHPIHALCEAPWAWVSGRMWTYAVSRARSGATCARSTRPLRLLRRPPRGTARRSATRMLPSRSRR
jgi:hypothetical protein